MTWHIPLLWPGATVAVLGSGPSLTLHEAQLAARSVPTICINSTFRLVPASLLCAADAEWWAANPDAHSFAGLKVSVSRVKGVLHTLNLGVSGYSDRTDGIHTFGNSGAQGIQLAAKAGAARIVLLGFDMRGGHWHPEHKAPLRATVPETYAKWIRRFDVLAEALKVRNIEVLNCSPDSALKCFPVVELETAFKDAVGTAGMVGQVRVTLGGSTCGEVASGTARLGR